MRVFFRGFIDGFGRASGRRTRPTGWVSLVEKLLLGLLALQVARLVWALVTPVGSFGPWEGRHPHLLPLAARQALFSSFDPFFRDGAPQAGNGVVTALALTLYGIRLNEGSGLGSAILATPDGVQNSFAVGDEIMPGVVLKAVAFDHVTIDRGGAEEQIFIDQSQPAPNAALPDGTSAGGISPNGTSTGGTSTPPVPLSSTPLAPQPGLDNPTADSIRRDIGFTPRLQNGRVTGLILAARGTGFRDAGFRPGDIVTRINGQPIGSAGDLQTLQNQIIPGARLSLAVERGAATASINLILQGQ